MKRKPPINGQLLEDIYKGLSLLDYDTDGSTWYALTRNFEPGVLYAYTEYETDEHGIFQVTKKRNGSRPTVIKGFREQFKPLPIRGNTPGRHRMTRGEWEAANDWINS